MIADPAVRRPGWPYWLIAALALLWNAFGCLDFTMTAARNPDYLAQVPPEVIDWIDGAPTWTMAAWALGVGGGLLGALCLLGRLRWAVAAYVASLLGLAANHAWQFASGMPASMKTPGSLTLMACIWIAALAQLWYAVKKRREGVLR